ncbi:ROK family protein [Cohnella sp. REN36]|uniref:ROK family protein n=1 Tax=Cohnella sp. REN36 TaxID=2887347 RepID=UPI001D155C96|nr:ROK family protein [Cohnella sp. REN36]MCC3373674.1 ROK family protein [Cohnella sp. REN36]
MRTSIYDPGADYAIGIDVGGTKINAGIVGSNGETLLSVSLPTKAGSSTVGDRIAVAVQRLLDWVREQGEIERKGKEMSIRGIGIGTAGQVDWRTGAIRYASDLLPGYTGTPLKSDMEKRFGLPVVVDNDVNVLSLAEKHAGIGKGAKQMICLALGTGVGGVLVNDGKIVHGVWGGAGEIGHLSVDYRGLPCICGGRGCLEAYASGTSIAKRMNERLAEAGADSLGGPLDTRATVDRWQAGDPLATAVMDEAIEALGSAISGLLHVFNPELVVIGGGLADVGEPLLSRIREETRKRTMPSFYDGVRIVLPSHGNYGGMIGAAMQLWEYR